MSRPGRAFRVNFQVAALQTKPSSTAARILVSHRCTDSSPHRHPFCICSVQWRTPSPMQRRRGSALSASTSTAKPPPTVRCAIPLSRLMLPFPLQHVCSCTGHGRNAWHATNSHALTVMLRGCPCTEFSTVVVDQHLGEPKSPNKPPAWRRRARGDDGCWASFTDWVRMLAVVPRAMRWAVSDAGTVAVLAAICAGRRTRSWETNMSCARGTSVYGSSCAC